MAAATLSPEQAEAKVLGRAIRSLRERAGLTQEAAAANLPKPVAAQAWARYEAGERNLKFSALEQIAAAVKASYEDLMAEREAILRPRPNPGLTSSVRPMPGMTPVYGRAAGEGDRNVIAAGEEIRFVAMHPAQAGYKRHGAAEVIGESMYPRYKPRELAYFVFDVLPPRGDDVIVEMKDGTAMIKEYVKQDGSTLFLRQFYPEERIIEVSLRDVAAMHAVVR